MVEGRHLEEIDHSPGSASPGIRAAIDHAPETRLNDGPCAHRARFFCHINVTIVQAPIPGGVLGLGDGKHLGMRGSILEHFNLVPGPSDNFAISNNDRSYRHFFLARRLSSLAERFPHEESVARKIRQFVHAKAYKLERFDEEQTNYHCTIHSGLRLPEAWRGGRPGRGCRR